jgi:hypothetical protein
MTDPAQSWYAVDRMYREALSRAALSGPVTVGPLLSERAELIWREYRAGNPAVVEFLGSAAAAGDLTLDRLQAAVAKEHGFADPAALRFARDQPVDIDFEAAADAIVSGDEGALRALLDARPELARARSPFGHHATLVHYVSANGVEATRQWQTPRNAVPLLRMLLELGADPDATCDTYGGGSAQTPMCLLVSSTHPAQAGVQAALVRELCRGGANADGLDNDSLPLWTAITWGYPPAAAMLASCGARVDNVVLAAGVGDLRLVERYLHESATPVRIGANGPVLEARNLIGYALIYAAGLARADVVQLLLRHGPDLNLTEPVFGGTALGAARYHGHTGIEALLTGA